MYSQHEAMKIKGLSCRAHKKGKERGKEKERERAGEKEMFLLLKGILHVMADSVLHNISKSNAIVLYRSFIRVAFKAHCRL